MKLLSLVLVAAFLTMLQATAAETSLLVRFPKSPFNLPDLEIRGRLGKTFEFYDCQFISGLTCTVKLRQAERLPSRVFVAEIYPGNKQHGKEWRLIYPRLSPGESGRATFRGLTGSPERLVLRGDWRGGWQDPY